MKEYEKTVLTLFAEGVRMAMQERGIGINELTEKTGVSKNSIYKVLRAENYEITILIKIMRILQIHLEFSLMDWDNNIYTMTGDKPGLN